MNKEIRFTENRIIELANNCFYKDLYTYTDFLNLYEQDIFNSIIKELPPVNFKMMGGNSFAERKIVEFSPREAHYDADNPIVMLKISPINLKFSEDLCHRDYLGAILNLGLDRCKVGDIFLKDKEAYIFCINTVSDFIIDNLVKVRHTFVNISIDNSSMDKLCPDFKEISGTISNIRLDALISLAFGLSRSASVTYISDGKVFVNGRIMTSNGHTLKDDDIVSCRGLGRFIYAGQLCVTKKGRNLVKIKKYI